VLEVVSRAKDDKLKGFIQRGNLLRACNYKFYYRRTTAGFLKNILMLINEDVKLYTTLSITIDCEGSVCTWNLKGRTTMFAISLRNEKTYVLKPLYNTLKQHYKLSLYVILRGKTS